MYDYKEAIMKDIAEFFEENPEAVKLCPTDTLMFSMLIDEDSITGNRTGSYFSNAFKAREALRGNEELYEDAVDAMGTNDDYKEYFSNPESADVLVRMFVISENMNEIFKKYGKPAE